jgi:ribose transport system permease protein
MLRTPSVSPMSPSGVSSARLASCGHHAATGGARPPRLGHTAGPAGLLLTAQLGAAGRTLGSTILLGSVAAIVIGGTALSGGVGGVGRTVLGVLILTVLSNGLNQIGAADYTQTIIKGLVIIVAAVFTMASQRKLVVK